MLPGLIRNENVYVSAAKNLFLTDSPNTTHTVYAMPGPTQCLSDVDTDYGYDTASNCDAESDRGDDTASNCDADDEIDGLHAAVINVIDFVTKGTPLGFEFRELIDRYHARRADCECYTLCSNNADLYHSRLLTAMLESYYGSDYAFVFNTDLSDLGPGLKPTDAQMSAMLPDECVPCLVQHRLEQAGIMEALPRLVRTADV